MVSDESLNTRPCLAMDHHQRAYVQYLYIVLVSLVQNGGEGGRARREEKKEAKGEKIGPSWF